MAQEQPNYYCSAGSTTVKFKVVVQRVVKEQYDMELDSDGIMNALDQARDMVKDRNARSTSGQYSVIKIDEIKEST